MTDTNSTTIPDVYSDLFNIMENPLGVTVVLYKTEPDTTKGVKSHPVTILRFSLENWKLIMMVGRKQLKTREAALGSPIKLTNDILTSLNITEADW